MDDDREYDLLGMIREEVESEGFEMDVGMRYCLVFLCIKLDDVYEVDVCVILFFCCLMLIDIVDLY